MHLTGFGAKIILAFFSKVAGDKGISKTNQNNRANAVTACIGL
jgi:hypothetical protein